MNGTILEGMKPKAQRKAFEQLTARGVTVKFNRRFAKDGDVYRCSKSNETLQPDIASVCVGMVPNTEFLQAGLPDILDDKGLVKVDPTMKVQGYENLYALGDCATLDTHKYGIIATMQGSKLADILLKSAEKKKIKPYKTPPHVIIAGTGADSGVAQLPFAVAKMNFIVNLKQKDLGFNNIYGILGTKPDELN
ncbi:MAG: FAD-dependent oxidoreductase [Chloroflexota bacterium]